MKYRSLFQYSLPLDFLITRTVHVQFRRWPDSKFRFNSDRERELAYSICNEVK